MINTDIAVSEEVLTQMEQGGYPQAVTDGFEGKRAASSQFYPKINAVFGQVIEGMDVVNAITADGFDEETQRPKTEIKIISIELTTYKASEEDSVSSAKTESDASSPKNDSETTSSNVK